MAYEIEFQGRVVYVRLRGSVTVTELARAVTEIAEDPQFDDQRFHVVDYSAAALPTLDHNVFNAIVPVIGATAINSNITAIVVPDNEQTRAFAAFCSPMLAGLRSVRFCQDRAQADSWISEQTMTDGRVRF
jgi:hypothetical protein